MTRQQERITILLIAIPFLIIGFSLGSLLERDVSGQALVRRAIYATPTATPSGIAEVGSGTQRAKTAISSPADSQGLAFPGSVTSGNLITAGGVYSGGPSATAVVTSTCSSGLTVQYGPETAGAFTFVAYGLATSSGACTVTVNPSEGSNYISFAIDEFSGVNSTPLDVDGGSSTGTSTTPSDGITTVAANSLIIGVVNWDGQRTVTPSGSYTTIQEEEDYSSYYTFSMVFRIATTATAYTVDWTLDTSALWATKTTSFKPV